MSQNFYGTAEDVRWVAEEVGFQEIKESPWLRFGVTARGDNLLWLVKLVRSSENVNPNWQKPISAHENSCVLHSLPDGSIEEWEFIRVLTPNEENLARLIITFGTTNVPDDINERGKLCDPHCMPSNEDFYRGITMPRHNPTGIKHQAIETIERK
jgi:hypothetical protein